MIRAARIEKLSRSDAHEALRAFRAHLAGTCQVSDTNDYYFTVTVLRNWGSFREAYRGRHIKLVVA